MGIAMPDIDGRRIGHKFDQIVAEMLGGSARPGELARVSRCGTEGHALRRRTARP
jgi:hypothetical protein